VFERIACGWSLLASSSGVLRRNKKLIVFPVLAGLGSLPVFVSFFYAFGMLTRTPVFEQPITGLPAMLTLVLACLLCWGFIVLFFYAALVRCALLSLRFGNASIWRGICDALSRLPQLLGLLLISASRVFLFRSLWLVVPILMDEKSGAAKAFSRSRQLLRLHPMTTFWPGLLSVLGPILVFTVFSLFAWMGLETTSSYAIYYAGMCILAWIAVCWTIIGIYEAALYEYAALGQIPAGFDGQALRLAFAGLPQNGGSWPS